MINPEGLSYRILAFACLREAASAKAGILAFGIKNIFGNLGERSS